MIETVIVSAVISAGVSIVTTKILAVSYLKTIDGHIDKMWKMLGEFIEETKKKLSR